MLLVCCSHRCSGLKARTQNKNTKGRRLIPVVSFQGRIKGWPARLVRSAHPQPGDPTVWWSGSLAHAHPAACQQHPHTLPRMPHCRWPQLLSFLHVCFKIWHFSSTPVDHLTLLNKKLVDWLRYASIVQVGGASSGGFFSGSRSRQVSTLKLMLWQIDEHRGLLHICVSSASAHSRAGRDGVGGFLHGAVCGAGIHRGPMDERLFLLYAAPLASHPPLCFQWQHGSRYR